MRSLQKKEETVAMMALLERKAKYRGRVVQLVFHGARGLLKAKPQDWIIYVIFTIGRKAQLEHES